MWFVMGQQEAHLVSLASQCITDSSFFELLITTIDHYNMHFMLAFFC
jgi:hypothetical protein